MLSYDQELSPQLSSESHKRGSISKILSFKSSNKKERKLNNDTVSCATITRDYCYCRGISPIIEVPVMSQLFHCN